MRILEGVAHCQRCTELEFLRTDRVRVASNIRHALTLNNWSLMQHAAAGSTGVEPSSRSKALLVLGLTLLVVSVAALLLPSPSILRRVLIVGIGCTVYGGGALVRAYRLRTTIQFVGAMISGLGLIAWLSGL